MRFKDVLHPEILMGKRGEKFWIDYYRFLLPLIKFEDRKILPAPENLKYQAQLTLMEALDRDQIFRQYVYILRCFRDDKSAKIYHVGKDLALEFSKIQTDIPIDILPERFAGYISFPKDALHDEAGPVDGAYVVIMPPGSYDLQIGEEEVGKPILWICYLQRDESDPLMQRGSGGASIARLLMPLDSSLKRMLNDARASDMDYIERKRIPVSEEVREKRKDVYRAIINTLVYLFSEEPFVEISRPIQQTGLSNKETLRRGQVINECTLPITFVYRDFHGVTYTKDKTMVRGHRRWQRCGPQLTKAKLIWIDPHERHYKTEEEENE